ncbi:MAG: hypothetical protein OHK0046_41700 [Anaerolineae bacterium]
MARSYIGYNIHQFAGGIQRHWSKQEVNYFFSHLERLQPTVLLFIGNRDWALQAKRLLPDCQVIFRQFYDENGLHEANMWEHRDPIWHIDQFARMAESGLALNIWNEPVPANHQVTAFGEKYAAVMDAFGQRGISIVGPNFAVGFPNETWMEALEPLWQGFDRWYHLHDYGIHEYGTHRGMLFFDPTSTFNVFPFRIGRQTHLCVLPYLAEKKHVIPNLVYTEWGLDAPYDGSDHRGWRTAWDEQRYFQELAAADAKMREATPHVRGYCIFSYGNSGQRNTYTDWASYDVMEAFTLHGALEHHAQSKKSEETSQGETVLENITWVPATAMISEGKYVNIRREPLLSSEKLGEIHPGESVFFGEQQVENWWPVKKGSVTGYAHADYFIPMPDINDDVRTYRFSVKLEIEANNLDVARLLALHLTSKLRDEYRNLKHAGELVIHMPRVSEFEIELETRPEEL